jgi:Tfp pilus assembly protein PilN
MSNEPLDLNLLPDRHRGFQLRVWHIALALMASGLLISLIPNVQAFRKERAATATVEEQLEQAMSLLETLEIDQEALEDLNEKIVELEQRIQQLQEEAALLRQQADTRLPGLITAITQRPAGITLTRLDQGNQQLTLQGYTDTQLQVLDYARLLETSGRFVNVRIEVIESPEPPAKVTFTIIAEE